MIWANAWDVTGHPINSSFKYSQNGKSVAGEYHVSANNPPGHIERLLDATKYQNAAKSSGLSITAFLAGPYIETTGKKPTSAKKNSAKRLRMDLYNRLTNSGINVTMGEYKKLIESTSPLFGTRTNAALAEIAHAKDSTNAVIMLPSSPGSFLELGAFAVIESICRKMLILIDKKYENDDLNYFNSGPIISAQNNGSIIVFADYDNHDICWTHVEKFITEQRFRAAEKSVLSC